jgi:hypothetical protein
VAFTTHTRDLRALEQARRQADAAAQGGVAIAPSEPQAKIRVLGAERRERRLARHGQVWALHRQGWPGRVIARHLGIGRATVCRYLGSESFPERKDRRDGGRSRVDPWRHVVLEHWNAGRRHGRWLFRALQQQHGHRGSYATLARYLRRLRAADGTGAAGMPPTARPRPRSRPTGAQVPARRLIIESGQDPKQRASNRPASLNECAPETALDLASGRPSLRAATPTADPQRAAAKPRQPPSARLPPF